MLNITDKKIKEYLLILCILSLVIRVFISSVIELGNDEVSYWIYALYPDFSHFDHPPMVGYVIRLFTFNMLLQNELFIRLASVVLGTFNTYFIYVIGREIKNEIAGFYCALLYTASIYCFVLTGIFILPDTPMIFFWLLSVYLFIKSIPSKEAIKKERIYLLLAGITTGLGMLSKYTAVFLWFGALVYILLFNRSWLRKKELYISLFLSVLVFLPVIIWNFNNNFISFTFQGERVEFSGFHIRPDFFATEIFGQIFYNNPINYFLILISLIYFFKSKPVIDKNYSRLLLLWSLPIIFIFLISSLFRQTLPHWSAPGFTCLIILTGIILSIKFENKSKFLLFPKSIIISILLLIIIVSLGVIQINYGIFIPQKDVKEQIHLGEDDISLDMYGWKQLYEKFSKVVEYDIRNNTMPDSSSIITFRWFPAAHYDFYLARLLDRKVYAIGDLNNIRNYGWINKKRGNLNKGECAYYIASSRDFKTPESIFKLFEKTEPGDTIHIYRNDKNVMNYFVFRMKGLRDTIDFSTIFK